MRAQQASREALLRAPVPVFLVNTSLIQRPRSGQASVTPSECIRSPPGQWDLELGLAAANPAFPGHLWPTGQGLPCHHGFQPGSALLRLADAHRGSRPGFGSGRATCKLLLWGVPSLGLRLQEAGVHRVPPPAAVSGGMSSAPQTGLVQRVAPGTGLPLGRGSDPDPALAPQVTLGTHSLPRKQKTVLLTAHSSPGSAPTALWLG